MDRAPLPSTRSPWRRRAHPLTAGRRGVVLCVGLTLAAVAALAAATNLRAQAAAVNWVEPANQRTGVWAGQRIIVVFNQAMDRATVEAGLTIQPHVPALFEWFDDFKRVEVVPLDPQAAGQVYAVTLATSIRDAGGRAVLTTPYRWSFTVSGSALVPQFSRGLPVQLVTPSGGHGVPFQPRYPRGTFQMALYRLATEDFVRAYAALVPNQVNAIDVAGLTPAARWTQTVDALSAPVSIDLPAGTPPGLYVAEVAHPHTGTARTLLMYSDYALTAAVGPSGTTFWTARPATGEPAPAPEVTVYDSDGRALATVAGDARGIARAEALPGARVAVADVGGHPVMVALDGYWYSEGYLSWYYLYQRPPVVVPAYAGHIHTDRPIYRPGHVVHYKATLRRMQGDGPAALAAGTAVSVTIRDAAGNIIRETTARTDPFGSVAGDLALGDEVSLGNWAVDVRIDGQTINGAFKVEEYVKPDYAVEVETDAPFYVAGDTARVTVQADYYFGQPVGDGEVVLRVFDDAHQGSSPLFERQGDLAADGSLAFSVPLPAAGDVAASTALSFEAEVTDAGRRPVYAAAKAPLHPAAFGLSLRNRRYGTEVGQPIELDVATPGHDGQPVAGRRVDLEIRTYDYRQGAHRVVQRQTVTTGADGKAVARFDNVDYGWYDVEATARDDAGRTVSADTYAWRYSRRYPWYWQGELEVTADQDQYADGDTARLLVQSPVTGTALITLERDGVYDELVVPMRGATPVDVPIKAAYAPNVVAKVMIWKPNTTRSASGYDAAEGQLLVATVDLTVPAVDRRLAVEVTPGRATYAPGDIAEATLTVRDHAGRPVRAQVAVAVIDKAVLALAADPAGDIFDAFWRPRLSQISTHDSLRPSHWYVYPEYDRSRAMNRSGATPLPGATGTPPAAAPTAPPGTAAPSPTAGAPGGPNLGFDDAAPAVAPRREFRDTAFWDAAVATGADGTARVAFVVPDNLTTWRFVARAVTVDTLAGEGGAEIVVAKPIMADPVLPRFAVQGDAFVLDVVGRNDAAGTQAGTCGIEAPGLVQLDPGPRELELPLNATRVARWSVVASQVGAGTVKARLVTSAGSDAIEVPFEVQPFGVPERWSRAGATTDIAFEPFILPYKTVPDDLRIEVRLTPSIATGIFEGAGALIGYPYGCVEQTMSKTLPNAVIGRLQNATGVVPPASLAELPEFMDVGIQKLYGFQHADGSWGWWSGGQNLYLSAYVTQGLAIAREAGYPVDAAVIERGLSYLARSAPSHPEIRMRAYAAFAMAEAGRPDAALATALFDQRRQLDAFALAALAMALDKASRRDLAAAALDEVLARATTTPEGTHWTMDRGNLWGSWSWQSMASDETSTAMALLAIARLRPADPAAPQVVSWLLQRRVGAGWQTTQTTAFALLALTDYVIASGDLRPAFDWTVQLDARVVASGRVERGTRPADIPPVVLTSADLAPGEHTLAIQVAGQGRLYYTVNGRMTLFYPRFQPAQAQGIGVTLKREYQPVAGRAGADGWHVGDLVNVKLSLTTAREVRYMLIEDLLPAGFEALNTGLATETGHAPTPSEPWRWWGYERKEIRDDRVTFFASVLPAGTHTFEYAARAVTPGTFAARPAEAYAMYRPDVWGRSASDQVQIDADRVAERPALPGDIDRDCRLTAFDAALVADAWGDPSATAGDGRDIDGDGAIDAADIALAGGRASLACGDSVPVAPGAAGDVGLRLEAPADVAQMGVFDVAIVLAPGRAPAAVDLGAWEATLRVPAAAFDVVGIAGEGTWAGAGGKLGPAVAGDTVRLGGFRPEPGAAITGRTELARLTLRARRAGATWIDVAAAQALTGRGGAYRVAVDGTTVAPAPWQPMAAVYLPVAGPR